jgi:hypothetical protein
MQMYHVRGFVDAVRFERTFDGLQVWSLTWSPNTRVAWSLACTLQLAWCRDAARRCSARRMILARHLTLQMEAQEEFPVPLDDSYIDEVHAWLELNEDEVCDLQTGR